MVLFLAHSSLCQHTFKRDYYYNSTSVKIWRMGGRFASFWRACAQSAEPVYRAIPKTYFRIIRPRH